MSRITLSDRVGIEAGIYAKQSFSKIAKQIRKDPRYVSEEIKRNRTLVPGAHPCGKICRYAPGCTRTKLCNAEECTRRCLFCREMDCQSICKRFDSHPCPTLQKPPYSEQIEEMLAAKKSLLKMQSASQKIGKLLDRFVHYKLALHVYALSVYMEVMLTKNFCAEYLEKVSGEIRKQATNFIELYSQCYDKIEAIKKDSIATQAAGTAAKAAKFVGGVIGKIPVVKTDSVEEKMLGLGDAIDEVEKRQLEKTLSFFMQHKDSGLVPVAEHIETINRLANKPVVMLYSKDTLCFEDISAATAS